MLMGVVKVGVVIGCGLLYPQSLFLPLLRPVRPSPSASRLLVACCQFSPLLNRQLLCHIETEALEKIKN